MSKSCFCFYTLVLIHFSLFCKFRFCNLHGPDLPLQWSRPDSLLQMHYTLYQLPHRNSVVCLVTLSAVQ